MTWRRRNGDGWVRPGRPAAGSLHLCRGRQFGVWGASQAGGGGVQAEFELDAASILTLDPNGNTFPSGVSMTHNGVTSTTAFHTWQYGPEKGLIRACAVAGKKTNLITCTHSAPGTAISHYLGSEFTTAVSEMTAGGVTTPAAIMYIISPTDASLQSLVDSLPGNLVLLERKVQQQYGDRCGLVIVGTIDNDQPFYTTARAHGRAFCASPTGRRAYLEPAWNQQVTTPHMTAYGEFVCGFTDFFGILDRSGVLGPAS